MTLVVVPYEHREQDTQIIHLAATQHDRPAAHEWRPALRDVIDGQRVVRAQFTAVDAATAIWLRDREGEHRVSQGTGQSTAPAPQSAAAPLPAATDTPSTWGAQLVVPTRAVRHDSQQQLAAQITAPVDLMAQPVQFGLEPHNGGPVVWAAGTWVPPSGRDRVATATLGAGDLRAAPGLYRVLVRVTATDDQTPVLDAGAVSIT